MSPFDMSALANTPAAEAAIVGSIGPIDPVPLVFHADLALCGAIAVFFILGIPRAVARFAREAEWTGFVLRQVEARKPVKVLLRNGTKDSGRSGKERTYEKEYEKRTYEKGYEKGGRDEKGRGGGRGREEKEKREFASDDSHTLVMHGTSRPRKPVKTCYPPHVQAWATNIPPVARVLRYRVSPGLSLAQFLLLAAYFSLLFFISFRLSNPFMDTLRTGYVAMSQIPVVYAFAAKNNVVGWFIGVGYEKLNYFHRFAGRMLVLAANVHSIGYFYKFAAAGDFMNLLSDRRHLSALIALACLDFLFIFSTSFWRQRAYNVFLGSHIICSSIFLPTVCLHKPALIPYVLAASAFLAVDHLLRTLKTRVTTAYIRPLPELSLTRIEMPELNGGWRAGQHVRLRILSPSLGSLTWAESHPFTIASVSGGQEGMVLMCKKAGRWTTGLYDVATVAGYGEGGMGVGRKIKVMVEGPYGGPGHTVFASYSAAVLVVGGSGITFAISVIQDLIQKDAEGKCRVKVIELIWSVQDPSCLTPLLPLFTSLIQQSAYTPLHISVHYTRAPPAGNPPFVKDRATQGLNVSAGRPRVGKVLDAVIARAGGLRSGARNEERLCGVIVGVCGPVGLGDEVAGVVGAVEPKKRDAVGGVEIHEEVFGW